MEQDVQIYLVTPEMPAESFAADFAAAMKTGHVAAVLIRRGELDEETYRSRVERLMGPAQAEDVAVILDDLPEMVRRIGADGVHLTGGIKQFDTALSLVKPEFIAGAGDLRSRHEAMLRGENGADYLMFGNLEGPPAPEDREMADWWAQMFEVPAAYADVATPLDQLEPPKTEFVVLGGNVWTFDGGAAAALKLAAQRFADL